MGPGWKDAADPRPWPQAFGARVGGARQGVEFEMTMQQDLALQRTRLANERTLLAYVRTFMGFLGLGVALIAVFDSTLSTTLGTASIAAGAVVMVIGLASYTRNHATLRREADEMPDGTGPV